MRKIRKKKWRIVKKNVIVGLKSLFTWSNDNFCEIFFVSNLNEFLYHITNIFFIVRRINLKKWREKHGKNLSGHLLTSVFIFIFLPRKNKKKTIKHNIKNFVGELFPKKRIILCGVVKYFDEKFVFYLSKEI